MTEMPDGSRAWALYLSESTAFGHREVLAVTYDGTVTIDGREVGPEEAYAALKHFAATMRPKLNSMISKERGNLANESKSG